MNGKPLLKDKDKPRKQRKKTVSQLKKEADEVCSKFVRLSHADENGNVHCYTCPKVLHWKQITNGHFASRAHLSTRYDERNLRPQCWGCQAKHLGNGKPIEFARKLSLEYGEWIVAEIYKKAAEISPTFNYQEVIETYTKKLNELKNSQRNTYRNVNIK